MEIANLNQPRVAMIQDGARRKYRVPLALQKAGILDRVFIDWFVQPGSLEEKIAKFASKFKPALGRKMAERTCPELDAARVVTNPKMALRLRMKMPKFPSSEDSFIWAARETAAWIIKEGFGEANVLYGFIRNAAPEAYREARARGLRTAGDQIIAPLEVEVAEMKRQLDRWPGWNDREAVDLHPAYLKWERDTWESLDRITCMSDYVCESLISVGVARERITVLPYPWIESPGERIDRQKKTGPTIVGFVGAVGLRKGAPYFLEVARRFDPRSVQFVMVGDIFVNPVKLGPFADRVQFVGPVTRSEVRRYLDAFDVFFFPSTCEGSAGAVMEAMGSGLPVVTTFNSGSSAHNGVEGFIRRYDDVDGFVEAIQRLAEDRDMRLQMGEAARQRVIAYNLDAYQADLVRFFTAL
jgi:glycosyltransferase involved in cell wall biosynthesis